ncbi:hypothetical protein [Algoriphagus jejuensis]
MNYLLSVWNFTTAKGFSIALIDYGNDKASLISQDAGRMSLGQINHSIFSGLQYVFNSI